MGAPQGHRRGSGCRAWRPAGWTLLALSLLAGNGAWAQGGGEEPGAPEGAAGAYRLLVNEGRRTITTGEAVTIRGVTEAPPYSRVEVRIGDEVQAGTVRERGEWVVRWPEPLPPGTYQAEVVVTGPEGRTGRAPHIVIVTRLPRGPLVGAPTRYVPPAGPELEDFQEYTDRWRITPPPYELNVKGSRWDPYNQNILKGDYPILGDDIFFILTAISDTLIDGFQIPIPSAVGSADPDSNRFFGDEEAFLTQQNVFLSGELFKGDTAFKPFDWRFRATVVGNFNFLDARETRVVKPDVRRGTSRTDGRGSLQEFFGEVKLADLSVNYDFISLRVGVQPFNSDFRGFIFEDTNLGVRLFGSTASNRNQFNLAYFERLEKDTNSGLNTFELRDQQVGVVNFYRQDFLVEGYNLQGSVHYLRDEPTFIFDRNGFLARPDPIGDFTPHEIEAWYFGIAGFGHIGRINVDHATYFVTGDDSQNPIAGARDPATLAVDPEVDIEAYLAALEISYDRDWWRPKLGFFYASGDDDAADRDAEGFDAIFDNPNFAGGGFSYWNRLGIGLAGTAVRLVDRGSLLPSVKSSKDEGQPNFVNPGIFLATAGVDLELTPKLRSVATLNYLRFDKTEVLEAVLFQDGIDKEIGWDLSFGCRYRPFLNENFVVVGGVAGFLPGDGWEDIFEDDSILATAFSNVILTF